MYGAEVPCSEDTRSVLSCRLEVKFVDDDSDLDKATEARYALVRELFSSVEGNNISQRERARLYREEQQYLTYGEIEYLSFVQVLQDGGAIDGSVFYDLGSGTGDHNPNPIS